MDELDDLLNGIGGCEFDEQEYVAVDFDVKTEEVIRRIEEMVIDVLNDAAHGKLMQLQLFSRAGKNYELMAGSPPEVPETLHVVRMKQQLSLRSLLANKGGSALAYVRGGLC
jgi:hypothetical protein